MIQQQRKGGSLPGTVGSLLKAGPSTLGRGMFLTGMREGGYRFAARARRERGSSQRGAG